MSAVSGSLLTIDERQDRGTSRVGQTSESFNESLSAARIDSSRYPVLLKAMEQSDNYIEVAKSLLGEELGDLPDVSVICYGSLARREVTGSSDFDYLVLTRAGSADGYDRIIQYCRDLPNDGRFPISLRPPGKSGLFGEVVAVESFAKHIGLDADTNQNHTRRVLLLEESAPLYGNKMHNALVGAIIEKYLAYRLPGANNVPRYLLNDIQKYWRTITVDYQAKHGAEAPYSLRYLKLRISRKITYLASVVPLILCQSVEDKKDFLIGKYLTPAPVRLAEFAEKYSSSSVIVDSVARLFDILEIFSERAGSPEWREQIAKECASGDPREQEGFKEAKAWGDEVQEKFADILLADELMPFTRKYMIS